MLLCVLERERKQKDGRGALCPAFKVIHEAHALFLRKHTAHKQFGEALHLTAAVDCCGLHLSIINR